MGFDLFDENAGAQKETWHPKVQFLNCDKTLYPECKIIQGWKALYNQYMNVQMYVTKTVKTPLKDFSSHNSVFYDKSQQNVRAPSIK